MFYVAIFIHCLGSAVVGCCVFLGLYILVTSLVLKVSSDYIILYGSPSYVHYLPS